MAEEGTYLFIAIHSTYGSPPNIVYDHYQADVDVVLAGFKIHSDLVARCCIFARPFRRCGGELGNVWKEPDIGQ